MRGNKKWWKFSFFIFKISPITFNEEFSVIDLIIFELSFGIENGVCVCVFFLSPVTMSNKYVSGYRLWNRDLFLELFVPYPVNFIHSALMYKILLVPSYLLRYLWNKTELCLIRHHCGGAGASFARSACFPAPPCAATGLGAPGPSEPAYPLLLIESSAAWSEIRRGKGVFPLYFWFMQCKHFNNVSKFKNIS